VRFHHPDLHVALIACFQFSHVWIRSPQAQAHLSDGDVSDVMSSFALVRCEALAFVASTVFVAAPDEASLANDWLPP